MKTTTKISLSLIILCTLIFTFINQYYSALEKFRNSAIVTTKQLNEHLHMKHDFVEFAQLINPNYQTTLIDENGFILINKHYNNSANINNTKQKLSADVLKLVKTQKNESVQKRENEYIFTAKANNYDWYLMIQVPFSYILKQTILSSSPIILISLLFLWALMQIEKRKRSEKQLHLEKELLKTTLISINEGIIVADSSGAITLMNPLAEKYTGCSLAEAYGRDFHSIFHNTSPKTGEKGPNPVKIVLDSGEASYSKLYNALKSKDGSIIYILGTASPIYSCDHQLTGVIVSFRDITKQYEQENEMEWFLNANLDMLCVADTKGNFLKVNTKFEEVLGYSVEEIRGKSFLNFLHQDDAAATLNAIDIVITQHELASFTNRYKCKDGTLKYIEWHAQLGVGKYIYCSARDVTEKVLAEKELENIAIKDQLTDVYNRHFFDMIIVEKMNTSNEQHAPLSMIILDLDRFKKVNDTWGHPVGDELLKHISQLTQKMIRDTDILVRFGGEEFVILLPETSIEDSVVMAENIRKTIETNSHPITGKQTASFGVAEKYPHETFDNWYKRLDEALYQAKETGRNKVIAAK